MIKYGFSHRRRETHGNDVSLTHPADNKYRQFHNCLVTKSHVSRPSGVALFLLIFIIIASKTYAQLEVEKEYLLYWSNDSLRLQWDKSISDDVDYYNIYRMSIDTATFQSYDTTFIDSPIDFDSTFYYGVTAVDYAENESEMSKGVSVLRIVPIAADYDRSLHVDFYDFTTFVSMYNDTNMYYDLDHIAPINFDDFILFVDLYNSKVENKVLQSDKLVILKNEVN